jgi:hypothetical protein
MIPESWGLATSIDLLGEPCDGTASMGWKCRQFQQRRIDLSRWVSG